MTGLRRTNSTSERKCEESSDPSEQSRKRKVPCPETEGVFSRPKRAVRKSVLLSSGDYEVSYPNAAVKEEEPEDDSQHATMADLQQRKRGRLHQNVTSQPSHSMVIMDEIPHHSETIEVMTSDENVEIAGEIDVEGGYESEPLYSSIDPRAELLRNYNDTEFIEDIDNENPPPLMKAPEVKRKRGRPRKYPEGEPIRRSVVTNRPRFTNTVNIARPVQEQRTFSYDKPITKVEAEKINAFNIKLFEDDITLTESGDAYATVIPGCLTYLLRKERIIDLLTNRNEINNIRAQGWMLRKSPRLPPLVTQKACFAFYLDGTAVTSVREISHDDLKPWSSSIADTADNAPVVKPNVRKHAVIRQGGRLIASKVDPKTVDIHLTEYTAWLPRCLRLRKKIFYLSRGGHIIGNVLILYDFTCPGEIPMLLSNYHANEALRMRFDEEFERGHMLYVGDNESPFHEETSAGPRGEIYLQVHPEKYGWTSNKNLLLKYLINEPALLEESRHLNSGMPFHPPLIENRGVFVHFVPAQLVADVMQFHGDALSPWTYAGATVNHRVRTVKRALELDDQGVFHISKDEWQSTGLALVETITILCRCPRLRKRIFYVQRNNSDLIGLVCFIYEFMKEGPIPELLKGNKHMNGNNHNRSCSTLSDSSKRNLGELCDDDIDVVEMVEEEIVNDDMHGIEMGEMDQDSRVVEMGRYAQEEMDLNEDLPEDCLDQGWDTQFEEDLLGTHENPQPFFDGVRRLETGHYYLTVRHKKAVNSLDTILEFIANTNFVEERGLLNETKPQHPPMVRNARSYAFFVCASSIYPKDINRDDFSPWSSNATTENPTCYRAKCRKYGLVGCEKGGFSIRDGDYKSFPYHLTSLYGIHPKESRLRKRIYYIMDTETEAIISHVMIIYEYTTEGPIPRINGPYGRRICRRRPNLRRMLPFGDADLLYDDVSDISETERESPFSDGPLPNNEDCLYLTVRDPDFLNDRNRQLHYLVNKPHLLDSLECINSRMPMFPPLTNEKGVFVYFMDGNAVDVRNLTCDALGPWSDNLPNTAGPTLCIRPKTSKIPLGTNRDGQLRVLKGRRWNDIPSEYYMHVYAATLPRTPRLKKRVIFITRDGAQVGHSMIAYWYTEEGEIPQAVAHGNAVHTDALYIRLPPSLREDARLLLQQMTPAEAAKELSDKHGMPVSTRAVYNVKREMTRQHLVSSQQRQVRMYDVKLEGDVFEMENSMNDYVPEDWERGNNDLMDITHSDNIRRQIRKPVFSSMQGPRPHQTEQVFRYSASMYGTRTKNDTFDYLWKSLLQTDEMRILTSIKRDFGVEIVADPGRLNEQSMAVSMDDVILHEEILDGDFVGDVIDDGEIVDEVVLEPEFITDDHLPHEIQYLDNHQQIVSMRSRNQLHGLGQSSQVIHNRHQGSDHLVGDMMMAGLHDQSGIPSSSRHPDVSNAHMDGSGCSVANQSSRVDMNDMGPHEQILEDEIVTEEIIVQDEQVMDSGRVDPSQFNMPSSATDHSISARTDQPSEIKQDDSLPLSAPSE